MSKIKTHSNLRTENGSKIVLSTLNAKYVHSSLGLRYLYANMPELQHCTKLIEFSINGREHEIAEQILAFQPTIIGFGVYIWNAMETLRLIRLLKAIQPNLVIILGGPEVSYECEQQEIVAIADFIITGQADIRFGQLCHEILIGNKPKNKITRGAVEHLEDLNLPYAFYNDEDIKNRLLYVEASRGCPFKCEFCLSALDKTSLPFNLDTFLKEIETLYKRGARSFKFVDRTFNLKISDSLKILEFFLARLDNDLFLHFEIIPDRLPEQLKSTIQRFPVGVLQFEIGVQSFNPKIQTIISRKQDNQKSQENLQWLKQYSTAHLHADLIFGLPGEDLESFATGFNQMVRLQPHDIQIGILKRLRGTPIIRHTQEYQLQFSPNPPYEILSNNCFNYAQVRMMTRFARYWEIIANSGHFSRALKLILADDPFQRFFSFSQWLFEYTGQTHKFSLRRLYDLLFIGGKELGLESHILWEFLWLDYQQAGLKGKPEFMKLVS